MRIREAWESSGLERIDAEVLLSELLGRDRTWVFAHPDHNLSTEESEVLHGWIARRKGGEPLAYVLRRKEFFGRPFLVDERVLIPRPETEQLVAIALDLLRAPRIHEESRDIGSRIAAYAHCWRAQEAHSVVDCGTGSGCIAVTLACERPDLSVIAIDASDDALLVARENVMRHRVEERVHLRRGNLLDAVEKEREPFLAVANLPYVPERYELPADVQREPRQALFGGSEGLDFLLPFVEQARAHPACIGCVLECREDQVPRLRTRIR